LFNFSEFDKSKNKILKPLEIERENRKKNQTK